MRRPRWWHGLGTKTPKIRFGVCFTCGVRHQLVPPDVDARFSEFAERHVGHALDIIGIYNPDEYLSLLALAPNADIKQALQAVQTLTVTNLHSLASSATAGWQSAEIDNTSNLYLDSLVQVVLDFANTAPANSKAAFVFGASGIETGKLSNPFSGSEGTLTLTDVTTTAQNARQIGTVPYNTADEVAEGSPMSLAAACGGIHPMFWSLGIINHSGAALAASGNTVKYRGVYATVI